MDSKAQYDPKAIEPKWIKKWAETGIYKTPEDATHENKYYILPQLPYPSGSGLHVGHTEIYVGCDILARFKRMKGEKVLQVMGWDAFGLPAENYAVKTNIHPRINTDKAIENYKSQLVKIGASYDWDREVGSHNPDYYKWTQWFFLLMYNQGLAYRKNQKVNWCPSCKTVLANEQVVDKDGQEVCERCDTPVEHKMMEQWYLKITEYADRLAKDLDKVDWPKETVKRQRDWIGRSEGAQIRFEIVDSDKTLKVFTTRPDTIFGATYMVLAPEHELVKQITTEEQKGEVEKYVEDAKKKTEIERTDMTKSKSGVFTGAYAINPATEKNIPIWIADYVLTDYGTGAIMAVPAHDQRDMDFAKKYKLEIKEVVIPIFGKERKDEEFRKTISAVVQRESDGKVLAVNWKKNNWVSPVIGGIDDEEDLLAAAEREVLEETGYKCKAVKTLGGEIESHFFADHKNVYRHRLNQPVLLELLEDEPIDVNEDEKDIQDAVWMSPEEFLKKCSHEENIIGLRRYLYGAETFSGYGRVVNSGQFDGLKSEEAKEAVVKWLEEKGIGEAKVTYKLRDWSVSRQRFWGAPIPMVYDPEGNLHPVDEKDLPVVLPDDVDFKPTGQSPLTYSKSFQEGVEEKYGKGWRREVDTLDTFMCSSWYYYRYLDPKNDKQFASPEALKKWMPVDFYLGGPEHVNGHLLYSRFFTKVLYDAGYIDFDEPFKVHRHQGLILGEDGRKMSKRWGNVINPTDVVESHGADTLRMYEMFMGPLSDDKPWSTKGVLGIKRFLGKVWGLKDKVGEEKPETTQQVEINKLIKKVGQDLETLSFNTAIAKMMEFVNYAQNVEQLDQKVWEKFLLVLAPFAPFITEELWQELGNETSIHLEKWPVYDENMAKDKMVTIAVQVNGKLRDNLEMPAESEQSEVEIEAKKSEKIGKYLAGKAIIRVIYVKDRLINYVVGE
ncbi:leucine--tRNA ligase [Candidatus Dojkabacteria bacterium]|nr:leucine--tRNA ligase [Candidatus Dojkabacteria bacterium]